MMTPMDAGLSAFFLVSVLFSNACPLSIAVALAAINNDWWLDVYDYATTEGQQEWDQNALIFFAFCIFPLSVMVIYMTNGLIWLALDLCFPKFFDRFRIQKQNNQIGNKYLFDKESRVQWQFILRTLQYCFFNMGVIALASGMTFYIMQYHTWFQLDLSRRLPGLFEMGWQIFVSNVIVTDVFCFYSHRWFHTNKWAYKHLHKSHHEVTSPNALASIWVDTVDFLVTTMFPGVAGMILLRAHVFTTLISGLLVVLINMSHHAGLHFPWNEATHHDLHHEYSDCNYGFSWYCDWLHGTLRSRSDFKGKRDQIRLER